MQPVTVRVLSQSAVARDWLFDPSINKNVTSEQVDSSVALEVETEPNVYNLPLPIVGAMKSTEMLIIPISTVGSLVLGTIFGEVSRDLYSGDRATLCRRFVVDLDTNEMIQLINMADGRVISTSHTPRNSDLWWTELVIFERRKENRLPSNVLVRGSVTARRDCGFCSLRHVPCVCPEPMRNRCQQGRPLCPSENWSQWAGMFSSIFSGAFRVDISRRDEVSWGTTSQIAEWNKHTLNWGVEYGEKILRRKFVSSLKSVNNGTVVQLGIKLDSPQCEEDMRKTICDQKHRLDEDVSARADHEMEYQHSEDCKCQSCSQTPLKNAIPKEGMESSRETEACNPSNVFSTSDSQVDLPAAMNNVFRRQSSSSNSEANCSGDYTVDKQIKSIDQPSTQPSSFYLRPEIVFPIGQDCPGTNSLMDNSEFGNSWTPASSLTFSSTRVDIQVQRYVHFSVPFGRPDARGL